jgi:hypothetical protein
MKHNNYEWIVAWAEGKDVQYKIVNDWDDVGNDIEFFQDVGIMFRIKPEKKRSHGYRLYLDEDGDVCVISESTCPQAAEKYSFFKEWIDKEWQYYEYEEEA